MSNRPTGPENLEAGDTASDWNRFTGLLACALLLFLGCGPAPPFDTSAPADSDERPNLLLITIDTLRADRLACYGGIRGAGIQLCEIFKDGLQFNWAFSTAPSTAPSVTSILTSLYPGDHGVTQFANTRLSDEVTTVAEVLRDAGYDTAAFIANPVIRRPRNLHQGFSRYDDEMTRRELNRPSLREREAGEVSRSALAWASGARSPWFLWIHYQDPHGPYDPPDATIVRDAPGAPQLPELRDHSGRDGIPAYQLIPGIRSVESYEQRYAQEIRYLEKQITQLIAELDKSGDSLSILLTADHGEAFGEDNFFFAHGHSVGLDQIRVPLFWRPASAETASPPRRREENTTTLNIAPTLLSEARLPIPDSFQGEILGKPGNSTLFAEHRLRIAAIQGQRYYARDRQPFNHSVHDAITGGTLPPIPPRTAALMESGRWGAYELTPSQRPNALANEGREWTEAVRQLEADIASFQATARGRRAADETEIDPETRDALKSLGYLK